MDETRALVMPNDNPVKKQIKLLKNTLWAFLDNFQPNGLLSLYCNIALGMCIFIKTNLNPFFIYFFVLFAVFRCQQTFLQKKENILSL